MKQSTIKFTETEIDHILSLIRENEREEWYWGDWKQFRKRSDRIKAKLMDGYRPANDGSRATQT